MTFPQQKTNCLIWQSLRDIKTLRNVFQHEWLELCMIKHQERALTSISRSLGSLDKYLLHIHQVFSGEESMSGWLAHSALSCAYIRTAKYFVDVQEIGVYFILVSQVPKSHKQVSAHWCCWFMLSSFMPHWDHLIRKRKKKKRQKIKYYPYFQAKTNDLLFLFQSK